MIYQIEVESDKPIHKCEDCSMQYHLHIYSVCAGKCGKHLKYQHQVGKKPSWCPLKKVEVQNENN